MLELLMLSKINVFTVSPILIIIIVSIIGKFKVASKGYEQIEDTLVEASKKYFSNNKDLLPQSDGETSEVMDSSLVQDGYMKEISKVTKRPYAPFVYYGAEDATDIIVAIGSVTEAIEEPVNIDVKKYVDYNIVWRESTK